MLTTEQNTLLALVRSALWGEARPERAEEALAEARKQAIVPLLFPESPEAMRYYAHYLRLLYAQQALTDMLRAAGIPTVILKGAAAAIYYPEPILRTMGDVDLLVPPERFQEALEQMERGGYLPEHENAPSEDHRHSAFRKDGILFELHRRFSSEGIDVEPYLLPGLEHPAQGSLDNCVFPMLPPLANGLVLLAHLAQHLRNGLGLRQVIDWMMYVHAELGDARWESEFRAAAADCGLETLAVTVTALCQTYLGLPDPPRWCARADGGLVRQLLENILETGNFGHAHGQGTSVELVSTNIRRMGLFRYLQRQGEAHWEAYHRHAVLRPLCWAYQAVRYVRLGALTGRGSAQLGDDMQRSRRRYELLRKLGID